MAEIDLAVLCTSAAFRDGLLSVLEAGLERFSVDQYPANLLPILVFRTTFREVDFGIQYLIRVTVAHEDGERVADIGFAVSYTPPEDADPRLSYYHLLIQALPLQIRRDGLYVIELVLDAERARSIPFIVEQRFPQV